MIEESTEQPISVMFNPPPYKQAFVVTGQKEKGPHDYVTLDQDVVVNVKITSKGIRKYGINSKDIDNLVIPYKIEKGFKTDLASYKWWYFSGLLVPTTLEIASAALVHDYLIRTRALDRLIPDSKFKSDKLADSIFYYAQPDYVPEFQKYVSYYGVRTGSCTRALDRTLGTNFIPTKFKDK